MSNSKYHSKYGAEVNSVLSSKPDLMIRIGNILVVLLVATIIFIGFRWRLPEVVKIPAYPSNVILPPRSPQYQASDQHIMFKVKKEDFEKLPQIPQTKIVIENSDPDDAGKRYAGIISSTRTDTLGQIFLEVELIDSGEARFDRVSAVTIQATDPTRKKSFLQLLLSTK